MKTLGILLFSLLVACNETITEPGKNTEPDKSADVALFSETGTWDKSVTALKNMFEWMNMSVAMINADYVNKRSLDSFAIVCFPGGDMFRYSRNISSEGMNKIKSYIKNGGNYIGICGGSYFSAEKIIWQGSHLPMKTLALFEGTAEGNNDTIAPYPQRKMCKVVLTDSLHPITQGMSKDQWILYYWGPVFKTKNKEIQVLGIYDAVNSPAILAFEYGKGKVFITGTHPEMEEDSDRDGVIFPDTIINNVHYYGEDLLEDKGSDWILMRNAVNWILK